MVATAAVAAAWAAAGKVTETCVNTSAEKPERS